ncbi:MAG: DNA mismatch repair protein MutT [Cyclobacteriaceae bacterium]|nr:DNA mismatch repair protein MutT [Cyclobacteriaceae bacterium]
MSATQNIYSVHPKFPLAVDCVVFGYEKDELKLLLYPRLFEPAKGMWSLMGGFVGENESLDAAVNHVLKMTVGLENIYMEQVGAFSEPTRDPGGRVISIAYYALIRIDEHDTDLVGEKGGKWWPITSIPELIFDHNQMVDNALRKLQNNATFNLIGKDLLPHHFTLTQLNNLYNAIFQRNFNAGNFRKKLTSLNALEKLSEKETVSSKRGAFYYKFKTNTEDIQYDRIVKL